MSAANAVRDERLSKTVRWLQLLLELLAARRVTADTLNLARQATERAEKNLGALKE